MSTIPRPQVSYLLLYGHLPTAVQLRQWEEAIISHSQLPVGVVQAIECLPSTAHPMTVLMTGQQIVEPLLSSIH